MVITFHHSLSLRFFHFLHFNLSRLLLLLLLLRLLFGLLLFFGLVLFLGLVLLVRQEVSA
jgi:hypothetical protein